MEKSQMFANEYGHSEWETSFSLFDAQIIISLFQALSQF